MSAKEEVHNQGVERIKEDVWAEVELIHFSLQISFRTRLEFVTKTTDKIDFRWIKPHSLAPSLENTAKPALVCLICHIRPKGWAQMYLGSSPAKVT